MFLFPLVKLFAFLTAARKIQLKDLKIFDAEDFIADLTLHIPPKNV